VAADGSATSAATQARFQALEATIAGLSDLLEQRAVELRAEITTATAIRRTFVQNIATATVHLVRLQDTSRAVCGWTFSGDTARARRRDLVRNPTFRYLEDIAAIPGQMLCERCLPDDRELAIAANLVNAEMSGDE
jgi:hypothetical protein